MKLGIALSGGGIRGAAEIGVLKALEENNIKPDIIAGTSCGSMIAVMYAMGYSTDEIYGLFKKYAKEIVKINTFPILTGVNSYIFKGKTKLKGCNDGLKIEELYNEFANEVGIYNINQIKMPIAFPAVDLVTGKECVFTNDLVNNNMSNKEYIKDISVGEAIRASSSFPGIYCPFNYKQYLFLDGGVLNNIPTDEVKKMGADKIIAIKFCMDNIKNEGNVMDFVMKSIDMMGNKISENNLKLSDYIIEIYTDKVGLIDVDKIEECYECGYNSVIKKINDIKKFLNK